MVLTAQDIITRVQVGYNDADTTLLLELLQNVYDDLNADYPIVTSQENFSSIVANTYQYPVAQQVLAIRSATWHKSSRPNDYVPLIPNDVDALDASYMGWREELPGTPRLVFLDGGNVCFWPKPNVGTVGGYPFATVTEMITTTLILTSPMPSTIYNHMLYVNGLRARYAELFDKGNLATWMQLYGQDQQRIERYLGKRNRRFIKQVTPQQFMQFQV